MTILSCHSPIGCFYPDMAEIDTDKRLTKSGYLTAADNSF